MGFFFYYTRLLEILEGYFMALSLSIISNPIQLNVPMILFGFF